MDQRFPKSARLLKPSQFAAVARSGHFVADGVLVVSAAANRGQGLRLGLAISRQVGNAVVRNRWKRALREAFRRRRHEFPLDLDIVVRPKRNAIPDPRSVEASLCALLKRLAARRMA